MLETVQEWLLVITNNPKPTGNQFCKAYKRYSGGPNDRFRSVRFIRTESLWSKRSERGHPTSQNVLQCVLRDQPCIRIVFPQRVVSILLLYQSKTRQKIPSVWNGQAENRKSSKNHGILIRVTTDCIPNQIMMNCKWFGYARGRMQLSGAKNNENSSHFRS